MNSKSRRRFRATAAVVAMASSMLGAQILVGTAEADSAMTWTPGQGTPANTGFWSNQCPAANAEPANLHTPGTLADDTSNIASTRTYVAGPGGLPDTAWQYAPGPNAEGGISLGSLPLTTTGLSIAVNGATTGRLLIAYTDGSGKQFVGEAQLTTTSGWQTVSVTTLTWYRSFQGLSGQYWAAPGNALNLNGASSTLTSFFSTYGNSGTFSAAFELGCTGAFAVDHLQVNDSASGVTSYDLQTPTSTTSVTQGATRVSYGATTTITPTTTSTDNGTSVVASTDVETLLSSTDNGDTWTPVATGAPGAAFTVKPTRTTQYQVQYTATHAMDPQPSSSAVVTVSVLPKAVVSASTSRVNVGKSLTFTLRMQPALANATVTFQQPSGASWVSIGTATTNSSGVATLVKSRSSAGAWKVRATVSAQPGYLAITSNSVTVGVYQPVSVSIARSASTVKVGNSFRIYGVVTPHSSGISLQLQQYVSGRWETVATGRSGTRGAYSFTKVARYVGTPSFRVVAPASGYRLRGGSSGAKVTIVNPYYPPPPPPSGGGSGTGGGGGGSGIG